MRKGEKWRPYGKGEQAAMRGKRARKGEVQRERAPILLDV
jgi:hypothetical protein